MALKASALKVGDTHKERVVENLSRTQIVQYAGASGDYNPLHTDEVLPTRFGRATRWMPPRRSRRSGMRAAGRLSI
jgi:acyl dehydratase